MMSRPSQAASSKSTECILPNALILAIAFTVEYNTEFDDDVSVLQSTPKWIRPLFFDDDSILVPRLSLSTRTRKVQFPNMFAMATLFFKATPVQSNKRKSTSDESNFYIFGVVSCSNYIMSRSSSKPLTATFSQFSSFALAKPTRSVCTQSHS